MSTKHSSGVERSALSFGEPFVLDAKRLMQARASQVLAVREDFLGSLVSLPSAVVATELVDARHILAGDAPAAASQSEPKDSSQVAILSIDGPLSQRGYEWMCGVVDGYDWIAGRFAQAMNDPKVGAVVLRINSPGGDAAGLEEAVKRMRKLADQQGKRVIAYADEQAASAAYWIAAGVGDEVMLPSAGEVGSIGCIGGWVDATEQAKAEGYTFHIVRDPPGKAAGHSYAPVAELADERSGAAVRELAGTFIDAMAARRPNAGGQRGVRALDGQMLRGKAAVEGGLANKVGSFEDAIKRAADAANRRRIDMKGTKALQALGLTEEATDEQIAVAARVFELGKGMLARTGESNPDAAAARVGAWHKSHEVAETERAALAAERTKLESDERVKLFTKQITAGWRTPGTTWAQDADGMPIAGKLLPHLAATPIEAVRAETETLCATPRAIGGGEKKPAETAGAHGLTEREIAICTETKCDPAVFAKLKATRGGRAA